MNVHAKGHRNGTNISCTVQEDNKKCHGATTPTFCATTPSCPKATSSCSEALRALLRARTEMGSAPAHPVPPQRRVPTPSWHKAPPQGASLQLWSPGTPQICGDASGGDGSSTLHGGRSPAWGSPPMSQFAPPCPALTFSLIPVTLSPITRFCASRKDFRAAAVPRRKASPCCRSIFSVACRVACALFSWLTVPLATASACREFSADARMLLYDSVGAGVRVWPGWFPQNSPVLTGYSYRQIQLLPQCRGGFGGGRWFD